MDSYYSVLGVGTESSDDEIRSAYRKLAMQWHPDKWIRNPTHLAEANRKFQEIQQAYSVLSDRSKRTLYDAGIYCPDDDEDDEVEGFGDFLQEMASLINDNRKQEKSYSIEELQGMFWEMAKGFEVPQWDGSLQQQQQQQQSFNESQWFYHGPSCNHLETRSSSSMSPWNSSMFDQGNRLFSKPEFFSH